MISRRCPTFPRWEKKNPQDSRPSLKDSAACFGRGAQGCRAQRKASLLHVCMPPKRIKHDPWTNFSWDIHLAWVRGGTALIFPQKKRFVSGATTSCKHLDIADFCQSWIYPLGINTKRNTYHSIWNQILNRVQCVLVPYAFLFGCIIIDII